MRGFLVVEHEPEPVYLVRFYWPTPSFDWLPTLPLVGYPLEGGPSPSGVAVLNQTKHRGTENRQVIENGFAHVTAPVVLQSGRNKEWPRNR